MGCFFICRCSNPESDGEASVTSMAGETMFSCVFLQMHHVSVIRGSFSAAHPCPLPAKTLHDLFLKKQRDVVQEPQRWNDGRSVFVKDQHGVK